MVAGVVAVGVVDRLEVVDVDRDRGEQAAVAAQTRELDLEPLVEAAAVEQAGERVGARLGEQLGDEAVVAGGERARDGGDDDDGHDDVDPAVEAADAGRHPEQCQAVARRRSRRMMTAAPGVPKKYAIHSTGHR